MRRRQFLAATAAATTLAAPAVRAANAATTIKFTPQADLALLDPVFTTGLVTRNHGMMVYDQLYGLDESFNPQPQMVDGHVVDNDGKTWTITLRDGLTFHDGEKVRAADAVASIQRWGKTDAFGQNLMAVTDELTATSDKTLVFKLKKPFPLLPAALAKPSSFCPVMPERFAKQPVNVQVTDMVGSGPFRFIANERLAGARAVYEKFTGYVPRPSGTPSFAAGPKAVYVDRVEWHTIPDASTAASALQQGEIDWWEQPQPDLLPLLRKNPQIAVEAKEKGGLMGMIRFNCLIPPFDNPAIRRALLGGVDQTEYMTAVMGEDRSLWNDRCGFFLPTSPFATEAGLEVMTGQARPRKGEARPPGGRLQRREGGVRRPHRPAGAECHEPDRGGYVAARRHQPRIPGAGLGHRAAAPRQPGRPGQGRLEHLVQLHSRRHRDHPGDAVLCPRDGPRRSVRLAHVGEDRSAAQRFPGCTERR